MKKTAFLFLLFTAILQANVIEVGSNKPIRSINKAIKLANAKDTVLVYTGLYREGTIVIDKKISSTSCIYKITLQQILLEFQIWYFTFLHQFKLKLIYNF